MKNELKENKKKNYFLELLKLYLVFAKIGSFTIGGGLAMMPMIQKELIEKRKWMTEEELLDYYAVGQSTPGIVAVNVSTFVGYKQFGIPGGFIATLGMITPSIAIIMIIATFINSIQDYPYVQKALKGINVAVAALLTKVVVTFVKKSVKNVIAAVGMILAFGVVFFLKVPSFLVILFAIALGVVLTYINVRKTKKRGIGNDVV
ncbi:MAG: chromate transporter [Treponema sp.]|nr:chromate transporter [Treponema sp.]